MDQALLTKLSSVLQRAELRGDAGIRMWDMGMEDEGHHREFGIISTPGTTQAIKP